MRELYERMQAWQAANQKRLLSVSIQEDGGKFCCTALTNPIEVVVSDFNGNNYAEVRNGCLLVV